MDPCGECNFSWLMLSGVVYDLEKIALFSVLLAALAAGSSKPSAPLYGMLIRTFMTFTSSMSPLTVIDWSRVESFSSTQDEYSAAEFCNGMRQADEEELAKREAVCRGTHDGIEEREACLADFWHHYQPTNVDSCQSEVMSDFSTFQYPPEIDEWMGALYGYEPWDVFLPSSWIFACMGVRYGENVTVPSHSCVVPGVEVKDYPGLRTGPPLQKFQACSKPNADPQWDWENPTWSEDNACGPYGQKCRPLDSCLDPADWDTCPPTRYRKIGANLEIE